MVCITLASFKAVCQYLSIKKFQVVSELSSFFFFFFFFFFAYLPQTLDG